MNFETNNPDGTVEFKVPLGAIGFLKSMSRREAWLEIIARKQTQLLSMERGEDITENMKILYREFTEDSENLMVEYASFAFPGLKIIRSETTEPGKSGFDSPPVQ